MGICSPTRRFTKGFIIGMKDSSGFMRGEGGRRKAMLWADLVLPLVIGKVGVPPCVPPTTLPHSPRPLLPS